ncbi:DUF3574 domain-containing protein [Streptomyces sp. NBC_00257]|uniref:DUF3574 domain-containing protein n=1 Tax=unclassified Streptomyces TaxID=2593676 RepID=UPI00225AD9BD|nr:MULTISPECIES: DUF3574 domain-containing protein [unclassified Streptomyces]WTB53678.1 DUF3574 domain-containing protein [Streptomyces sp. NBC_00826]WTH93433.1 DUF3574 domain-containing protein [Streptomyces sp. NBC_00825]WTI02166.1 DUF3574 domain-containing protein [Streptomyces sp. NBC_00822]MCX4867783.1 DUF3574 domain-containing protein [Streptomyces sp. NBC_00906]MCX4899021.1 DUF3574 domain-containing protein [Streptomyces sp. NBC_00892]
MPRIHRFTVPRGRTGPQRRTALTTAAVALAVLAVGTPVAYATLGDEAPTASRSTASALVTRGKAYIETRLLFGTERPDGGPDVTDRQFLAFIDAEVTPRFPNGLTVQDGRGQWRDSNGVIERERSYELTLLYPASEARVRDARIERIRDAYEKAYAQDSVARLEERTTADF